MILVTGATGNVGREVVAALINRKQPVRAAAIDQDDAQRLPAEADVALLDFTNPDTYASALKGVQTVFLIRPPQLADMDSTLNPFVDLAQRMGVNQIIFVSLLGVEDNPRVPHYDAEKHIRASGVSYTFLRPSFFMQNLNTTHREEIRERDEIYIPASRARTSFIDVRDIGAVAATVLTEAGHKNKTYDLTGGEALDYFQVAEIFSQELGREISYRNPSIPAFVWYSWRHGRPLKFTLVMALLYKATRAGDADVISDDVNRLLSRPPISFREYVQDYAACWKK